MANVHPESQHHNSKTSSSFQKALVLVMGDFLLFALSAWNASFASSLLILLKIEFKFPLIHALFVDSKLILSALAFYGAGSGVSPGAGATGLVGLSISDSESLPDVTIVSVPGKPPGGSPAFFTFLFFFSFSIPVFAASVEFCVAGSEHSFPTWWHLSALCPQRLQVGYSHKQFTSQWLQELHGLQNLPVGSLCTPSSPKFLFEEYQREVFISSLEQAMNKLWTSRT